MVKNVEKIICVDKEFFNKARLIIKDTSDLILDENKDKYLIEEKDFKKVFKELSKILKDKEMHTSLNIKGADLSRYNDLKNKCNEIKYNYIRDNFEDIKTKEIDVEQLLILYVELFEEIENILNIKQIINQIEAELNEIKSNNLSDNINSYVIRFKSLVNNGGLIGEYINLKKELDLIIKKSYEDNIASNFIEDKKVYLVKNEGKVSILTSNNLDDFTYGYIYSPSSIKSVISKNNKGFVSFNSFNSESCTIELNDEKPIATYAVTLGEKDINPNYNKAMNLNVSYNTPFIEIDKPLSGMNDDRFRELINNLLTDKNMDVKDKDESYYDAFLPFIEKFNRLKQREYYSSQVINEFDFYFNYIFSQRYLDIKVLLDERLGIENIRTIFENNIYYDFNIFRNEKTNKTKIKKFVDMFYEYRLDRILNNVYPGINVILEELNNSSNDKIEKIIDIINSSTCHDSWLLSQKIKPAHIKPSIQNKSEQKKENKNNSEDIVWFFPLPIVEQEFTRHK